MQLLQIDSPILHIIHLQLDGSQALPVIQWIAMVL